MDPEALLEGLDGAQRAAVTSTAMPLVVLAPAGSGKTRVLTRRIAYRVATGAADPRHVLALTFTRKAAGELDDRLRRLGLRGDATTGTFHAVAWAHAAHALGGPGSPTAGAARPQGPGAARAGPDGGRQGQAHGGGSAGHRDRVGQGAHGHARRLRRGRGGHRTEADRPTRARGGGLRRLRAPQAPRRARRLRRPARPRRPGARGGRDLRGRAAVAVPPPLRRRAAGREPPPVPAAARRGVAIGTTSPPSATPCRRSTGGTAPTPASSSTSTAGGRPAEVVELDPLLPVDAGDPRGGRGGAAGGPADRAHRAGRPRRAVARRLVRGYADDRAEAVAISRAIRLARAPGRPWSEQAVLVRTHAQTHLIAEALREAGIPHRVRGAAAFLDRPEIRRALRALRDAHDAAGHRAGGPRGAARGRGADRARRPRRRRRGAGEPAGRAGRRAGGPDGA